MARIAVITGGASGIGLAVATGLSQYQPGPWTVHILDANSAQGTEAASNINATFHQADVTDYTSLAAAFRSIYQQHKRIDFVHANAGVTGPFGFVDGATASDAGDDGDAPPPPPDLAVLEVNLKGVVLTSWLATHYLAKTKRGLGDGWEGSLVLTCSVAGLYASYGLPLYTTTKYGVLGLTRSLAPEAYAKHSIRINCICPGYVKTPMTIGKGIPDVYETPIQHIVDTIIMLIGGKTTVDAAGEKVEEGEMWGRAVEVSGRDFWFREMLPFSDQLMEDLIGGFRGWVMKK